MWKILKMNNSTSEWSAQHPNTGCNMQQLISYKKSCSYLAWEKETLSSNHDTNPRISCSSIFWQNNSRYLFCSRYEILLFGDDYCHQKSCFDKSHFVQNWLYKEINLYNFCEILLSFDCTISVTCEWRNNHFLDTISQITHAKDWTSCYLKCHWKATFSLNHP